MAKGKKRRPKPSQGHPTRSNAAVSSTSVSPTSGVPSTLSPANNDDSTALPISSFEALQISDPYAIPVHDDRSETIQTTPALILRSDRRNKTSPYITYLPPGSKNPTAVFIDTDLKRVKEAAKWSIWTERPVRADHSEKCYEIKALSNKRSNLFAKRDIDRGELIAEERPFLITLDMVQMLHEGKGPANLYSIAASRLPAQLRNLLLSFENRQADRPELDNIAGRLVSQCRQVDMSHFTKTHTAYQATFLDLTFTNPSCSPNANYTFQSDKLRGRLYAMRDIKAGEAIRAQQPTSVLLMPRHERMATLRLWTRMDCECPACSASDSEASISDKNRAHIRQILELLAAEKTVPFDDLNEAVRAATAEGLHVELAELQYEGGIHLIQNCFGISLQDGDAAAADTRNALLLLSIVWLGSARDALIAFEGPDSPRVKQRCALIQELETVIFPHFTRLGPHYTGLAQLLSDARPSQQASKPQGSDSK